MSRADVCTYPTSLYLDYSTFTLMTRQLSVILSLIFAYLVFSSLNRPADGPPGGDLGPYLNGVFSDRIPGEGGSWTVEDSHPRLQVPSPLRITPFLGTEDHLVLSKLGTVYRVSFESQEQSTVLDLTDRSFNLGESGATGLVLHPKFAEAEIPEHRSAFMFYRYKPEPEEWGELGFNRLSRFLWSETDQNFDPDSEEILIQQYDRSTWHNGGGIFFGPDGYLYLALGDEGFAEFQASSTQRLDGGFFGGLLRIDIDKDPSRSHPIRRQPSSEVSPPTGWGDNFSQGYYIPNDNPWLDPDGGILEEYAAVGLRSPYSTHLDEETGTIWCLDVGSDKQEEFNHLEIGDNLQWPFKEGIIESEDHARPQEIIGTDKEPIYSYDRSLGNAVIAGGVYRGDKFLSLSGKYLHADFTQNRVMALNYDTQDSDQPSLDVLIPDIRNLGLGLPEMNGITGLHVMKNGEVILTVMDGYPDVIGKFLTLKQKEILPDPPAQLSELGVFKNLETLEPIDELIPYTVNAPLWSDRALKKRWMAVPNLESSQRIKFQQTGEWAFPEGTVFIKHFELPLTLDEPNGPTAKLETRFFILGKDGIGYGLTYKWNKEETDATLLRIGDTENWDITEGGEVVMSQEWDYPSRTQCLTCHNANAGYVLGVNTYQLNCEMEYMDMGLEMNQLEFLSQCGLLDKSITAPEDFPKAYPLDDGSVDLELRIKSYMAANCATCHRKGGVVDIEMDLRFSRPVELHNTIFEIPSSLNSDYDNYLIEPGNHQGSELWQRDASLTENRMPPLSRNMVDQMYVDSLAKWIDGLELQFDNKKIWTYPNPTGGELELRLGEDWELPMSYKIYDQQGRLLKSEIIEEYVTNINLSEHSKGVYFLIIEAEGRYETRKILKL